MHLDRPSLIYVVITKKHAMHHDSRGRCIAGSPAIWPFQGKGSITSEHLLFDCMHTTLTTSSLHCTLHLHYEVVRETRLQTGNFRQ